MERAELERLFREDESDRVERKGSAEQKAKIRRTICALANDLPEHDREGVIFVGQADDGSCSGLTVDDDLLKLLVNFRDDGTILPRPSLEVRREVIEGCEVAVMLVRPAAAPPVRCEGRVWVRVGPTTRESNPDEERRLRERRRAADLPFDLTPVHGATIDDLDIDLFEREYLPAAIDRDVLDTNSREVEAQLCGLRLITPDKTPTVLGLLVSGKDPTGYVPGALVQFLRVGGDQITDPIRSQKSIVGPLATQIRLVEEVLRANVSESTSIEGGPAEQRTPDYPVESLRQLLHNAVAHRTYEGTNAPIRWTWFSDRVEIQSPGGPFGQVTRENFGTGGVVDYRNPHVVEAMRVLGFVQRCGIGIPLAKKLLAENGNPEPEFVAEANAVVCIVRRRP